MKQVEVKEGARRQHRIIALFAAINCWAMKTDGLVFERNQLLRLLGLQQFKDTRVNWLRRDMRELFPFKGQITIKSIPSIKIIENQ